jgi:hypothetical protein
MPIEPKQQESATSVSDSILKQFFAELAKQKDMASVSERLEATVLGKRTFSEAAIRAALFEEDAP